MPIAVALIVMLLAAIPFALNGHVGVLGEGIYSNDHAVHLYWADWLQNGMGAKPRGSGWAIRSARTRWSRPSPRDRHVRRGRLQRLPARDPGADRAHRPRRARLAAAAAPLVAAALVGLPFLAASFFAQSSFKETALALFVLAFALALAALSREGTTKGSDPLTD